MENLEKMPQQILSLHIACCGFEDIVWLDMQVCNDISMHKLATEIFHFFNIEDFSNYTIVSAGEKFTAYERKCICSSDSKKYTMADLYMDKNEKFVIEVACHEFVVEIVDTAAVQGKNHSSYPRLLSKSEGSMADVQRMIDSEFSD